MNLTHLVCRSCGAALDKTNRDSFRCPFCGSLYTFDNQNSANDIEGDFQIESGVLLSYFGASHEPIVPSSVSIIGKHAFAESAIQKVIIPHSVTEIDAYAFADCSRLTSVTIPGSVKKIGCRAFFRCFNLTDLVFETNDFSCPSGNNSPFIGTPMHESLQKEYQQIMESRLREFRISRHLCPNCGKYLFLRTCSNCGYRKPKD